MTKDLEKLFNFLKSYAERMIFLRDLKFCWI